jgi:hypothetical protein
MITIVKFTAILAIAAILALSPFMTMTALAVKGDFGGSNIHSTNNNNNNNIKHFDNGGGNSKQITHSVDRHFNNNNNFKLNNHNDNFNNKFNHNNDNFRFHNNDNFRFHNNNHNNNVKVIHKTVVVHDRDNNQRTIVINSNLQGTCFVTQSQAANVDNLVAQLLDQCVSVTIIQG